MSSFVSTSRAEHAVNLAAASVPAIAAGWSGSTVAPLLAIPLAPTVLVSSSTVFVAAYLVMRLSCRRDAAFDLTQFDDGNQSCGRVRTFLPPPYVEEESLRGLPLVPNEGAQFEEFGGTAEGPSDQDVRERFASQFEAVEDELLLEDEVTAIDIQVAPADKQEFALRVEALSELMLDDPLLVPSAGSRVVQLFAPDPWPTAGEMAASISRHIACRDSPAQVSDMPDATAALNEALENLRNSLRRA